MRHSELLGSSVPVLQPDPELLVQLLRSKVSDAALSHHVLRVENRLRRLLLDQSNVLFCRHVVCVALSLEEVEVVLQTKEVVELLAVVGAHSAEQPVYKVDQTVRSVDQLHDAA